MSERKVLNKYYPIDYDPRRLPRQKGVGSIEDKIMVIRTMAPFHMRCKTCGNYIYRGTKFNSRVETVKGEKYLGTIPIRRFYIRCTKCVATITFRTDPENQDYAMESGATRNFEANRMWQLMEKREADAKAEEEKNNPMIALENRTEKSNRQMIMQENLEELYELAEKIGAGGGESAKAKALNILQTAIQKDKDDLKAGLEAATDAIKQLQEDVRNEAGRLGEDAEEEEDDAQVQVREILAEIDPSELLMLNMEEQEERFGNFIEDKKQKKLKEALDKGKSKKKFANLVKTGESSKKGISFKQYQANLKAVEEKKKQAEEKRKQAEESLKSSFAAYGSSSSSEDEADAPEPPVVAVEEKSPEEPIETEFKEPLPPAEVPVDELPPGFVDPPAESSKEKSPPPSEDKKRPAEIGSADFWSSVIKKKR